MDGRKTRQGFASIVYETCKDFAENTSIHGLKYAVKTGIIIYEKIFWVVVVLGGLCGAAYMTLLFWSRYNSNPTRTSIMTAYAPNTAVPFPAITICNINRIMKDQVEDLMNLLNMKEDEREVVGRAFPQLLAFTSTSYKSYNMSELMVLHNVLTANAYTDMGAVMREITQPCKDMLRKCMWQYKVTPCEELFEETLTTDGYCCSFNYIREYKDRKAIHTPFNDFNSGLQVLLDPEIQTEQFSTLHSSGYRVLVHSPWDYPGLGSIYKIVSAGRQSYLQVSASKIVCSADLKRLSVAQRQCAYSDEVSLNYFQLYSDTNCLTECEEHYLYQKCGCVPFYYPFSTRNVCNITSIPCLGQTLGTSINCNCPSQCEDLFYTVLSSTATLHHEDAAPTSSFLVDQNVTEDSVALYIYFSGQRQTILYKDIITSTIYLLSSFGGVYSLFLGCSFITVVEIIYYCTFRLVVNLKILGRIDKATAPQHRPKREKRSQPRHQPGNYEGTIFLN